MDKHYRVVGMVMVKNEVDNMQRWLSRNGAFLDGIVALDNASDDGTRDILRAHPKVISLTCDPPGTPYYVLKNRQLILEEAKKTKAEWLFYIDADSIMDRRLLKRLDDLLTPKEVGQYRFREINLWRSTKNYRIDQPERYHRIHNCPTLVRNNPDLRWVSMDEGFMLNFRRVLVSWLKGQPGLYKPFRKRRYKGLRVDTQLRGIIGKTVDLGDIANIHYHYADWDEAWKKQVRYALNYSIALDYKPREIDSLFDYVINRMDEDHLQLAPVKPEWGVLD
jgi:hypothetical protein